jgi:hypothetical protein
VLHKKIEGKNIIFLSHGKRVMWSLGEFEYLWLMHHSSKWWNNF